jgi:hypothetical protein
MPSGADVGCTIKLRMALREAGIWLEDSLVVTPTETISLQRFNDDERYRARIEAQYCAELDARLQRMDDERATWSAITRGWRHVQRSVDRLEQLAARV